MKYSNLLRFVVVVSRLLIWEDMRESKRWPNFHIWQIYSFNSRTPSVHCWWSVNVVMLAVCASHYIGGASDRLSQFCMFVLWELLCGPLRESLCSSATVRFGWRSHSKDLWSCGLEREMLFHVSALPLAAQLWCLFSLHLLARISHQFVCSFSLRRYGHRPPKPIGKKNGKFWRKLPVSVWLDALHNFKKQRHTGFFHMSTCTWIHQQ